LVTYATPVDRLIEGQEEGGAAFAICCQGEQRSKLTETTASNCDNYRAPLW